MDIHEFKLHVQRTLPDLGTLLLNSIHMTLGMGSEIFEELVIAIDNVDDTNVAEELADAQWYLCNYATLHGITIYSLGAHPSTPEDKQASHTAIGRLQDFDKKELAYGKMVDPRDREITLQRAINYTEWIASDLGVNMNVARQRVIDKLRKRFPEKFDSHRAIHRDVAAERRILEGGDA